MWNCTSAGSVNVAGPARPATELTEADPVGDMHAAPTSTGDVASAAPLSVSASGMHERARTVEQESPAAGQSTSDAQSRSGWR
jgi:hypothetical protein